MTNEELVNEIQKGRSSLYLQLWNNILGYVHSKAQSIWNPQLGNRRSVDLEDLVQGGYIALTEAVQTYDPQKGTAFTTWFTYYLKKTYFDMLGFRRNEPCNNAISLNMTIGDGEDNCVERQDLQMDNNALEEIEAVEHREYCEKLRASLDQILKKVPDDCREVLIKQYYENKLDKEISKEMGVSYDAVKHMKERGCACFEASKTGTSLCRICILIALKEQACPHICETDLAYRNAI